MSLLLYNAKSSYGHTLLTLKLKLWVKSVHQGNKETLANTIAAKLATSSDFGQHEKVLKFIAVAVDRTVGAEKTTKLSSFGQKFKKNHLHIDGQAGIDRRLDKLFSDFKIQGAQWKIADVGKEKLDEEIEKSIIKVFADKKHISITPLTANEKQGNAERIKAEQNAKRQGTGPSR